MSAYNSRSYALVKTSLEKKVRWAFSLSSKDIYHALSMLDLAGNGMGATLGGLLNLTSNFLCKISPF